MTTQQAIEIAEGLKSMVYSSTEQAIEILIQQAEKMENVRELNKDIGKHLHKLKEKDKIAGEVNIGIISVYSSVNEQLTKIINE